MNVGGISTTGDELRAVSAAHIQDGETFTISTGTGASRVDRTIEFDSGLTVVAPTGAADPGAARQTGQNETLTVTDERGTTAQLLFANDV